MHGPWGPMQSWPQHAKDPWAMCERGRLVLIAAPPLWSPSLVLILILIPICSMAKATLEQCIPGICWAAASSGVGGDAEPAFDCIISSFHCLARFGRQPFPRARTSDYSQGLPALCMVCGNEAAWSVPMRPGFVLRVWPGSQPAGRVSPYPMGG